VEPVENVGRLLRELDRLIADLDHRLTTGSASEFHLLVGEMKRVWSDEQAIDAHHVIANRGTRFEALVQRNWGQAVSHVYQRVLAGGDLTQDVVKQLHSILFQNIDQQVFSNDGEWIEYPTDPGKYRSLYSHTVDDRGVRRSFLEPEQVPVEIDALFDWYRTTQRELHPLELAARFSSQLTRIHPFIDGNGRIARLTSNYVLLEAGYPPVIYKMEQKKEYLAAKMAADDGRHEPLILLIAREVEKTLLHFLAVLPSLQGSADIPHALTSE
jgi:Fic family protein